MSWVPRCSDCGWSGKPTTSPARADYAASRHSCDKHRRAVASRERRLLAEQTLDRTPKPCLHKRADHQHGTHAACVLDRCRCIPCKDANAAYERRRTRQTAYGRWQPFVDADPVRAHVRHLAAAGIGLKTVVKRSGVAHGALWKLMYGRRKADGTRTPSRLVRRETATAVLAITPASAADGATVDPTGTQRRVQALMAAGWSLSQQAAHLGVAPTNFPAVLRRAKVLARTARDVAAMYQELAGQPPPQTTKAQRVAAARARNYAAARGWHPPVWWEDEWLDDPAFIPGDPPPLSSHDDIDPVAVERACAGERLTLTFPERREAVRTLHARGMPDNTIARNLHLSGRTVLRIRQELGLPATRTAA